VALAMLLGCDYLPKGVPHVGRDMAMKFISSLPATSSVLERCVFVFMFMCTSIIRFACPACPWFVR